MKMLNSNICCKDLDEVVEKVGRIIVPTKDKKYRSLQVVVSGDDNVKVGDVIYVPIASGIDVKVEKELYTIVNAREIILILD
jgi:co-chaperonin GroES (HSP10)